MAGPSYRYPNSPLRTVFEVPSPPEDKAKGARKGDAGRIFGRENCGVARAPTQSPGQSSPASGRRPHPLHAYLTSRTLTPTPSALLHNDWYLNQLLNELVELYKPGALTGFSKHYRQEVNEGYPSHSRNFVPAASAAPVIQQSLHKQSPLIQQEAHAQVRGPEFVSPPQQGNTHLIPRKPLLLYEMPPKRKAKGPAGGASSSAKANRSTGRRDLLEDEKHIFSAKSKLIGEDLTAFFASPMAWDALSEEEKEHVRSLLPPDIPYTTDGAPSQEFLRYDNDWRNFVRLFAEDVEAGHYEPEWLEEAQKAMEARSRGDFDQWKEEQFEEFWGQKSDAHADLMAGEAVKIRLGELIGANLFKVGDVFTYARTFGKGKLGFLVQKDAIIIEISEKMLSFSMAPGQLRELKPDTAVPHTPQKSPGDAFRRSHSDAFKKSPDPLGKPLYRRSNSVQSSASQKSSHSKNQPRSASADVEDDIRVNRKRFGILGKLRRRSSATSEQLTTKPSFTFLRKPTPKMEIVPSESTTESRRQEEGTDSPLSSVSSDEFDRSPWKKTSSGSHPRALPDRPLEPGLGQPDASGLEAGPSTRSRSAAVSVQPTKATLPDQSHVAPLRASSKLSTAVRGPRAPPRRRRLGSDQGASRDGSPTKAAASPAVLVTIEGVDSLHTLEQKILEVDGRRKGEPRANAWRTFRCKRGQEDLGTLWDIREAYYTRKYG